MKLLPNTLTGLVWGLSNFDGIEFDLNLTKDNDVVIHHDPFLESGEFIKELTLDELKSRGIPTFAEFLAIKQVIDLTNQGRTLWIEIKANCDGKIRNTDSIATAMYSAFVKNVSNSGISKDAIKIIGFSKGLIQPFAKTYPTFALLPDVADECNKSFLTLRVLPKFFIRSLTWHMKEAVDRGFAGVMFARQYYIGSMSFRHLSYEKMIQLAETLNIELGTNLGTPDLEPMYTKFHRVSDKLSNYPRFAGEGEGKIIAHRGTGTKGVEVPDNEVPKLEN